MKFNKSNELIIKARRLTPLGAQTYSKSYRYYVAGHAPLFLARGKGSKVWDVDGNKYVDFVCALGPVTVGYANSYINRAIKNQLRNGITFSLPHPISLKLAEKLSRIIPGAEMMRFLKNGADATFAAVKLARAFTNKELILMCGYHGMHNWSISVSENNAGVPKNIKQNTLLFEYNNKEQIAELFTKYKDNIAAVILEPIQANGPEDGYLDFLRSLTINNDSLLIFDEVVSGFRYALGGAAEMFQVTPDIIAFGKGMANGMPLSVVAGRKEIIELIETKKVFISTTFGGETLSMASALATIKLLEQDSSYPYIWKLGKKLRDGLIELVQKYQLESYVDIVGLDPHCGPVFKGNDEIDKYDLMSIYNYYMIANGVITIGIINISLSHSINDVNQYLKGVNKAFLNIKEYVSGNYMIPFNERVNPVFKR
jgi:glutamate-1-semialdehyde 2,1-aminomutase